MPLDQQAADNYRKLFLFYLSVCLFIYSFISLFKCLNVSFSFFFSSMFSGCFADFQPACRINWPLISAARASLPADMQPNRWKCYILVVHYVPFTFSYFWKYTTGGYVL